MLKTTINQLCCPICRGKLLLHSKKESGNEVSSGSLECKPCRNHYPILGGVALLVADVESYLQMHVKGISQAIADSEIPKPFLKNYLSAKSEIESEHIEEDLEAERVISLYFMNQYLRVKEKSVSEAKRWWEPLSGSKSELFDFLIQTHWDSGPMAQITTWLEKINKSNPLEFILELGCGTGGISQLLNSSAFSSSHYLGVDSSFASICLARHLALGAPYLKPLRIPSDLLFGPVSRVILNKSAVRSSSIDFIVGDIEAVPVQKKSFNAVLALNAIDMLDKPELLPKLQSEFLKTGGVAIQSGPYIWHEAVASRLRKKIPKNIKDSASAVEWLYEKEGLKIQEKKDHLPWLFFKHVRQLEIYSVHVFYALKLASN